MQDGNIEIYHDFHESTPNSYLAKAILASSILGQEAKDLFWSSLKKECRLNSEEAFWADILLKGETKSAVSSLYISDCVLRDKFIGNGEQPLSQCTFANVKFINCIFDESGLQQCFFISCSFDKCRSIDEEHAHDYMDCEFYNCNSWLDDYQKNYASDLETCIEENEDGLEIQILRKYLKVDNRTRRMKMISKVREDFNDCQKEFHKCFEHLISSGMLFCNGDKSFLTDEGFGYITEQISK